MMQVSLPDAIANIPTPKLDQGQFLASEGMNVANNFSNNVSQQQNFSFTEALNQILSNSLAKIQNQALEVPKPTNNEETIPSPPQILNQHEALANNNLFVATTQLLPQANTWGFASNNNFTPNAVKIPVAPVELSAKNNLIDVNTKITPQAIQASQQPLFDHVINDNNEPLIEDSAAPDQIPLINKSILPEAITNQPKYYSSNEESNFVTVDDKASEKISSKQQEHIECVDEENPQALKPPHAQESIKHQEIFTKEHQAYKQTNAVVNDYYQENLQAFITNKTPGKIEVQLHPQELGSIEIVFDFNTRNKEISITAEKLETLEMLQKDARNLEKVLNDVGLRADNSTLSFSLSHGNNRSFFAHEKLPYENNLNTTSTNEVTTAVMRSVSYRQLDLVI